MDNNWHMSVIAFMDDDAGAAGERYLFEFCKIALYQNGYEGMNISELRLAVQELIPFDYTEEDILRTIAEANKGEIELVGEKYNLTSEASIEIQNRDKKFHLRKYIDDYCDLVYGVDATVDRNALCDLVTRFIFEKFQESVEQIYSLLDSHQKTNLEYSEDYSDENREFINGFLTWDNNEKNLMIYKLVVRSYDFCMINCPESISFDFSSFKFYLDANIIMRLLGINNAQRKEVVERFINKCNQVGIQLYVSCFTKQEIEKSIEKQLEGIEAELNEMGRLQHPQSVQFGYSGSYSIDLYKLFYDYCMKKSSRSLNGFKTFITKEIEDCIKQFNYDEEVSFQVSASDKYEKYTDSLKKTKDEPVVSTDVNNILLLLKRRTETKDVYMISADRKLINWCKDVFVGQNSLVEFPSVWMSIIMKYTGRATSDDYSAFCRFIRLPIIPKDKDIKKKADIKVSVESMSVSDQMKDRIIGELNHNFSHYSEFATPDEVAQKAYEKVLADRDESVRAGEREKYGLQIDSMQSEFLKKLSRIETEKEQASAEFRERLAGKEKEHLEAIQQANSCSVDARVEKWIETKVNSAASRSKWLQKHKKRILLYSAIGIVFIIVILALCKVITFTSWIDTIFAGAGIVLEYGVNIVLDALCEKWDNVVEIRKKYEKKARKKFKEIM